MYLNYYKNKIYFFSLLYVKLSGKTINFDNKKSEKATFIKTKKINRIDDIHVNNISISQKEPYRTKNSLNYFTGYNENDVIRPLCITLPQMTDYAKKFDENAAMSFRVNDKQHLKNYNKI